MKTTFISLCFITFMTLGCSLISAQQLVYHPTNPNFGGNPLNYTGLLASAGAQNPFKDDTSMFKQETLLEQFSNSVKRQILNKVTRGLTDQLTDVINAGSGTITAGGLVIDVDETLGGSIITIIDTDTGESTQIEL